MSTTDVTRILIVDDNHAIHDDFRKILTPARQAADLDAMEDFLFDARPQPSRVRTAFAIESAYQGQEAFARVTGELARQQPFSVAFVDMRMPPGWDGLETIERLWQVDPDLQIVICSAYSDYTWDDLRDRLGERDDLLIIKKPFDSIEVVQCAHALATKWRLARAARRYVTELEDRVRERTADLVAANRELGDQMRRLERIETELRLSQKLESVGRLAAGIAHEINTPTQFVCDTSEFVGGAIDDLVGVLERHRAITRAAAESSADPAAARAVLEHEVAVDLAFLLDNLPGSVQRMNEGLARIATIVRSVQAFAHPSQVAMRAIDLAAEVDNTLTIARNEYKYVADVEIEHGELPPIVCHAGEINQVVLNLVVNAAHAIADVVKGTKQRGKIRIATRRIGDLAEVSVTDTGTGIPAAIRDKIFDPFFTTKPVGMGTGQGLAIAHTAIAKHGGTLVVETEEGRGTTFRFRIPIAGPASAREAA